MTDPAAIAARHAAALEKRRALEPVWRACYDHALPPPAGGPALFDATAADAAEQLAASLLAELTPPWSRWFGLAPARPVADTEAGRAAAEALEDAAAALQGHFDRSNFAIGMHQAFLDLVVAGTGLLLVEEAPLGESSAFRFTAVPLRDAVLEEGPSGRLDTVYRTALLTVADIRRRYSSAELPPALLTPDAADAKHPVLEAVWPDGRAGGTRYAALLTVEPDRPVLLAEGRFAESPCVAFRWLKAPGETYGRGPVMKALPDIRTANTVVEMVLKNASIAVTGIWQAEDDGVLNPATVRLVPGSIIPKAPGSAGLTPLAAPGNFDISQLVLNDLRARIRASMLADRLGPPQDAKMTATEVLERGAQTARLLGATYGRLQAELLTPLVTRCLGISAGAAKSRRCCSTGAKRRCATRARSPASRAGPTPPTRCCSCNPWPPSAAPRRRRWTPPRPRAGSPAPSAPPPRCWSPSPPTRSKPRMAENLLQDTPPPADAKARPADVPEKFWDAEAGALRVDALLKSYRELERRLSQRAAPPAEDAGPEDLLRFRQSMGIPETPCAYAINEPHELCRADEGINQRLHAAHFSNAQAQLVYDLAAERLVPLIAEAAAQFEADRQRERLCSHFGGEDRFRQVAAQLSAWGRAKLPEPVYEALASTAEGVLALEQMMRKEEPGLSRDSAPPARESEAELRAMMRDPRYWRSREPEFVRRVSEGFRRLVGNAGG